MDTVTVLQCLLQNDSVAAETEPSGNERGAVPIFACPHGGCKKKYLNPEHLKAHERFHNQSSGSASQPTKAPLVQDSKSPTGSGLQFLLENDFLEVKYTTTIESKGPVSDPDEEEYEANLIEEINYEDEEIFLDEEPEEEENETPLIEEKDAKEVKQKTFSNRSRKYACQWPNCTNTYTKAYHLKVHQLSHTGDLLFICDWPACNKRFARADVLNRHRLSHNALRNYVCQWCSLRFNRRDHLQQHIRGRHPEAPAEPLASSKPEPKKTKTNTQPVKRTKKESSDNTERERNYRCSFEGCDKSYIRVNHLNAHKLLHIGAHPYRCPWEGCGATFARSFELSRHRRKHTGERKFVCHICQQAFMRSDHLSCHVKRHTFGVHPADKKNDTNNV
ncbi:zinc finger protein 436-like [Anopheles aquasalis]|uniref:zinc finger protein 436-like n=1 Tax=Anopheles aquasalis TaxID=42839 RepID=UPI00215A60D8|nr:zinc finger protein 436-like [Anopheles aquasalis]